VLASSGTEFWFAFVESSWPIILDLEIVYRSLDFAIVSDA